MTRVATQMLFPVCRPLHHLHWGQFFTSASPLNHKQREGSFKYTLASLVLQNLAVLTAQQVLSKGHVNIRMSIVQTAACKVQDGIGK